MARRTDSHATFGRFASHLLLALASTAAIATVTPADAGETRIALGEVTVPRRAPLDADAVRTTAERELSRIDTSKLPRSRTWMVSLAVTGAADDGAASVNATLSDRRTGTMVAVLEGRAHTTGPASREQRAEIVRAAVRSAMRQIPEALPRK